MLEERQTKAHFSTPNSRSLFYAALVQFWCFICFHFYRSPYSSFVCFFIANIKKRFFSIFNVGYLYTSKQAHPAKNKLQQQQHQPNWISNFKFYFLIFFHHRINNTQTTKKEKEEEKILLNLVLLLLFIWGE